MPRGYEAYSEFRPYEEISAPVAPSAILQRNTPSMVTTGCTYKVLIELKRKMYEILTGESFDEVLKQKQPYMVRGKDPVKENMESLDHVLTPEEVSMLESVYGLTTYGDKYKSPKAYMEGDMILPLQDGIDMSPLLEGFELSTDNYNAIYDPEHNMIIATETINPYDSIIINLEG